MPFEPIGHTEDIRMAEAILWKMTKGRGKVRLYCKALVLSTIIENYKIDYPGAIIGSEVFYSPHFLYYAVHNIPRSRYHAVPELTATLRSHARNAKLLSKKMYYLPPLPSYR